MDSTSQVRLSVFTSLEDARSVWEAFEKDGQCYAFQSHRWLSCWQAAVGVKTNVDVYIVLVEHVKAGPILLMPFGIKRGWYGKALIPLGGTLSDYQAPLLGRDCPDRFGQEFFRSLWRQIKTELPDFDLIRLERMPEMIGQLQNPFVTLPCSPHPSSAHSTRLFGTVEDFIIHKRSRKWASGERRKERRLAEHGAITFFVADNRSDIAELLPVMMRQKSDNYRKLGVRNLFTETGQVEFLEELSRRYASEFFVVLCGVRVGERIYASFWGLNYRDRLYFLLPAYELGALSQYSIGNILLRKLFQWCVDQGVQVFDFTVGDEPYKQHWCDQEMQLYDYFEGISIVGRVYVCALKLHRVAKRQIKSNRILWHLFQRVRARH